jgi:hypothetical protein
MNLLYAGPLHLLGAGVGSDSIGPISHKHRAWLDRSVRCVSPDIVRTPEYMSGHTFD